MKKILLLVLMLMITSISCFAKEEVDVDLEKNTSIQKRINEVGFRILNANKLDHHITFFYHDEDVLIKGDPSVVKRQVVIYDKDRKIDLSASRFLKYFHEQQPCESE